MKIKCIICTLALAAIAATSSVAMATTGNPDCGTWKYGSSGLLGTWSDYKQSTHSWHSATVESDHWLWGYDKDTEYTHGVYASALCGRGSSGSNFAYYNHA